MRLNYLKKRTIKRKDKEKEEMFKIITELTKELNILKFENNTLANILENIIQLENNSTVEYFNSVIIN